jgi:hypothetical protein
MDDATRAAFERAAWAAAEGVATEAQLELLQADTAAWKRALERLMDETEDGLDAVQGSLTGAERIRSWPTSRPSSTCWRRPTTG